MIANLIVPQFPFDNYVVVREKSDLPTPSAGVITLAAGTFYAINGIIGLGTDRIEFAGDCKIQGLSAFSDQLIYTGSGDMFTMTDINFSLSNVTVISSTVGSKVFEATNNAKDKSFVIQDAVFAACNEVGKVTGFDNVLLNVVNYLLNTDGWEFDGVLHLFFINQNFDENNTGTYVDIKAGTFELAQFSNNVFHANVGVTGLSITPATITVDDNFSILGNLFFGTGTPHTGFTTDNSDFVVRSNSGIEDFRAGASMTMAGNVTSTNNVAGSTWTKIAGTTTLSNEHRFSMPSDNRLQYDGLEPISVLITFALAAYYTSGSARIAEIAIYKNGVLASGSINGFTIYGADEPCSSGLETEMANGDYIEVWFQKFGGAAGDDYVFSYLNVQIKES